MTHEMRLLHGPFMKIASGTKTVEMRLYAEKRSGIRIGDTVIFTDTGNGECVRCAVTGLNRFRSFEGLYAYYSKASLGYGDNEKADPGDMLAFYFKSDIEKYGVVGIEIRLLPGACRPDRDPDPETPGKDKL